jgi:hypothetical protein
MLTKENGKILLDLARRSVESTFKEGVFSVPEHVISQFSEPQGVFVTIHKHGKLRGCIGYPTGIMPLHEGIVSAAKSAAFQDPRFPPLSFDELHKVDFEVSVLTAPERVLGKTFEEIVKTVRVGKHGLIIKNEQFSGLLLPHVASQYGWTTTEFLQNTCNKAGLHEDAWLEPNSRLYTFQAHVFQEE